MKDALALALVHFIWQGALLAIAGALLMRVTRVPSVRYAIGIATMLAMLAAPVMTFVAIRNAGDPAAHAATQAAVTGSHAASPADRRAMVSANAPRGESASTG